MNDKLLKSLVYDSEVGIAVADSRTSKTWKPIQLKWSALLKKFSHTKRTSETVDAYMHMSREQQSRIKDVGGFVGGLLKEGRRKAENLTQRSLITLDVDFPEEDFWAHAKQALNGKACCIYTTHKHRSEVNKFRLVVPLAEPIEPDKYEAISRLIAEDIGIDQFDDTTYQAHRLMYWPSTSKDGEFIFDMVDGPWITADDYLSRYEDWRDMSEWPVSSRQHRELSRRASKQEDPLTKRGVIGAFCRTYDIHDAIAKFLPNEYEQCVKTDRYTYCGGSTSAGAVVYDDKFLYSHHSTDPGCEKLLNAFDLVRVHKFGDLDAGSRAKGENLPSFKAMFELASSDDKVKIELTKENMVQFEDLGESDNEWMSQLDVNVRTGKIIANAKNVELIWNNDPRLKGLIGTNELTHKVDFLRSFPWNDNNREIRQWRNVDDSGIRFFFSKNYDIYHTQLINDGINLAADRNAYHPIRDYLATLEWDKVPRLEKLFIEFIGGEDTELTRVITRKALIGAVRRVMQPGYKFDYVVTFTGEQGVGKSTIIRKLGREWVSDSLVTMVGKEPMEAIQGFWLVEIAELSAMRKAEIEQVKQFLTKTEDSFRPAYGRCTETYPRQCIFFATTNEDVFIRDTTGGRRFWPIRVEKARRTKNLFTELTDEYVDQVWAEAKYYAEQGESTEVDAKYEEELTRIQQEHTEESPLAGAIREFVERKVPADWYNRSIDDRMAFINGGFHDMFEIEDAIYRDRICAQEIWVEMLQGNIKDCKRSNAMEINAILKNMPGWKVVTSGRFGPYGIQRGYVRAIVL